MKRFYIAIILVVICIFTGVGEILAVNYAVDKCLASFEKADTLIDKSNTDAAINVINKATEEYENLSENLLFCFYSHNTLEDVTVSLVQMSEYLKYAQLGDYKALMKQTKKQLQSIKDEELFKIQNIL